MTLAHAHTLIYAMLCGCLCFVVAFLYERNGSRYKFFPSLVAFIIAASTGVEWLQIMGSIILYQSWPTASPFASLFVLFLLILSIKERGNVARILGRLTFVRTTKLL